MASYSTLPNRALLLGAVAVAASTAVLPSIGGYGTILFQVVVLGAWGILAAISSGQFADLHHGPLWAIALLLNLVLFLVPATSLWVVTRRKWPIACAALLIAWCMFYLLSLFLFFPATDGP